MIKSNIYVIQDSVSGAFGSPFFASCDDQVKRDFEEMVSSGGVPDRYIKDTLVICLGTFNGDPVNPYIDAFSVPSVILRGDQVAKAD